MMINLKRSLFWAALYLVVIFVLAGADFINRPIINFASYFYLTVMIAIPITLFFPSISRAPFYVPMLVWAGIYLVVLQVIDRGPSTKSIEFAVIVLEFVLLEVGVWLTYQLAVQISHTESIMDGLAMGAFPSRARDLDAEYQQIKIEFARSRRYNRHLSLVVIESEPENDRTTREMMKSIQHDLSYRFRSARVGQLIDDRIRQTDLIMKDRKGRFVILCPETVLEAATLMARRITQIVQEKTDFCIRWGVAAFPEDALTFEDLLQKALEQLANPVSITTEQLMSVEDQ